MSKKREINRKDYPMVVDWSGYENTHSKLPCQCEVCGCKLMRSVHDFDDKRKSKDHCRCTHCSHIELTGKSNPMNNHEVMSKHRISCLKRSGREQWQYETTLSKENLKQYIESLPTKPTTRTLSKLLGFKNYRSLVRYINDYDLWHLIDRFSSTAEKEISEYIETLGYTTTKKQFKKFHVDIFIPSLYFGIEFNGIFWHDSKHKDKYYHQNKVKEAEKNGIKLYHVWEDEWEHFRGATKEKIRKLIVELPENKYVEPKLVERSVPHHNRLFSCWSEGVELTDFVLV